jgi:hypothetical protein
VVDRGRPALVVVAAVDLGDDIRPQAQLEVPGVGHGFDTGRVDCLKGLDQVEDPVQLPECPGGFVGGQFEPREVGDPGDILQRQRQWKTPIFVVNLRNYKV